MHSWTPLSHVWGTNFFNLKGGINMKMGVGVEIGGMLIFYYFTAESHLLCV